MTKMKHAWFPVTLSFMLTHSSDRFNYECVIMKLRVTGNHACFILVILNCILLYTHVYWALSNSICCNFPQLIHDSFEGIVFTIEKYMLFHCEIRLPEMEKKFKYWYPVTTHPIENKMQAIWNTSASEMIFYSNMFTS